MPPDGKDKPVMKDNQQHEKVRNGKIEGGADVRKDSVGPLRTTIRDSQKPSGDKKK